jgi:hypothetical protein
MSNPTPVTVGLDVHARSVRLAALRADELLEDRPTAVRIRLARRLSREEFIALGNSADDPLGGSRSIQLSYRGLGRQLSYRGGRAALASQLRRPKE